MNKVIVFSLITAVAGLSAARTADILSDTGVTMENIRRDAIANLTSESWFFFNSSSAMRKMARRIPEGSRATAVRTLGNVVRKYCESTEFKNDYLNWLRQKYNVDETYSDEKIASQEQELSMADGAVNQQLALVQQTFAQLDPAMLQSAIRMQIQQQERELANLSSEERTRQSAEIAEVKKMLAATQGKPAEFKKQYLAYQTRQMQKGAANHIAEERQELTTAKERNSDYKKQKAVFDAHSDFRPMLRQRLKDFIALCNDVDFGAKTMPNGYKQDFVNPVYRQKPSEWKFLYRLGKEPVMEARAFAQQWLSDLEKK